KKLPVTPAAKLRAKDLFYRSFGAVFRDTQNYQLWRAEKATLRAPSRSQTRRLPSGAADISLSQSRSWPWPDGSPIISIVIPVFGKLDLTRACLESVRRSKTSVPVEIIVVDDCSPEPVATGLADFDEIQIVRNDTNLGFLGACNRGASLAHGKYLVFLNNDAEVLPDSLNEMISTFACVPDAGLVGAKLVFPDGRLQEAGAFIRPDGTAEMVGLWDDPNRPRYNFV